MMKTKLCTLALGAFFVPAAIFAGCGGVPGDAVATVDGTSISKSDFDHWMTVAAKSGGQSGAAAPKPPSFADCIKQKRKTTAIRVPARHRRRLNMNAENAPVG